MDNLKEGGPVEWFPRLTSLKYIAKKIRIDFHKLSFDVHKHTMLCAPLWWFGKEQLSLNTCI